VDECYDLPATASSGRGWKWIYIEPFILCIVLKRSDMDHTVLPENYTMPTFSL